MTGKPITLEEVAALFGDFIPISAATLVFHSPGDRTIAQVREELLRLAKEWSANFEGRITKAAQEYNNMSTLYHDQYLTVVPHYPSLEVRMAMWQAFCDQTQTGTCAIPPSGFDHVYAAVIKSIDPLGRKARPPIFPPDPPNDSGQRN